MWSKLIVKLVACTSLMGFVLLGVGLAANGQATAPGVSPKAKAKAKAPLDLNKATAEELQETLPGVGEVTAKKIVAGRPYTKVDDLAKAGVPARTIEAIRAQVTVGPPPAAHETKSKKAAAKEKEEAKAKDEPPPAPATAATPKSAASKSATAKATTKAAATKPATGKRVNLNTASKAELDALPGIGPVKSQAIIDARPFKSIEDIKKVKGIKDHEFSLIKDVITVD